MSTGERKQGRQRPTAASGSVQLVIGMALAAVSGFSRWMNGDTTPDRIRLIAVGLAVVPAAYAVCVRRSWPFVVAGFLASVAVLMSLGADPLPNLVRLVSGRENALSGPVLLLLGALIIAWACFSEAKRPLDDTAKSPSIVVVGVVVAALLTGGLFVRDSRRPQERVAPTGETPTEFRVEKLNIDPKLRGFVTEAWVAPTHLVRQFDAADNVAIFIAEPEEPDGTRLMVARDGSGSLVWKRSATEALVSASGIPIVQVADKEELEILDPSTGKTRFTIPTQGRFVTVGPWIIAGGISTESDSLGFFRVDDPTKSTAVVSDCIPEAAHGGDTFVYVLCTDSSALAVETATGKVTYEVESQGASLVTSAGPAHVQLFANENWKLLNLASGTSSPTTYAVYLVDAQDDSVLWRAGESSGGPIELVRVDPVSLAPTGPTVKIELDPRDMGSGGLVPSGNMLVVVPRAGVGTEYSPAGERRRGIALYDLTTGSRLGEVTSATVVARPDFILVSNPLRRSSNVVVVEFDGVVENGYDSFVGVFRLTDRP